MNRTPFILAAGAALSIAAATASAQYQAEPARKSIQLAERVTDMKASLSEAITTAEKHTDGVAIALRMSTNREQFQIQKMGTRPEHRSTGKPGDRDTRRPLGQDADRSTSRADSLYAIVTCVIDEAQVREVVVDLKDKSIVGVYSVAALRDSQEFYSDRHDRANASYASLVRATDLMNATVKNGEDNTIGDLENLAIDPDSDRVIYGVLSRGGFLGMGESQYAIAYSELSSLRDGRITLNLDDSDFSSQSGFDNKKWPTQANRDLVRSWDSEFADHPTTKQVVKASDVIGSNVKCSDGKLGKIDDLIVEPRTGRVVYAVVKSDRGMMPIPMSALQRSGDSYTTPKSLNEIRSMPTFDEDREPNWSDAEWNRRIHASYGAQLGAATTPARNQHSR